MTEADWAELGRYLRWCANELGLRDWHFVLSREPSRSPDGDEIVLASVKMVYGRRYATVRVCEDFRKLGADDQRMAIVHELLHCHIDQTHKVITDELYVSRALSEAQYRSIYQAHYRAIELATDGIATAITMHFPLIAWPGEAEAARTSEPDPGTTKPLQQNSQEET